MKKRLLCYDADNPVGIDENGVLNPSALGGGADIILETDKSDFTTINVENPQSKPVIVKFEFQDVMDKLQKGEMVTAIINQRYVYSSTLVFYGCYKAFSVASTSSDTVQIGFVYSKGASLGVLNIRIMADGTLYIVSNEALT